MHRTALSLIVASALGAAALVAGPAAAIVPPKNCKTMRVEGKRYQIKSDQLKCRQARRYAARFLRSGSKPRGYRCFEYSGSKIVFRCVASRYNPDRTYFAIKK